MGTNISAAEAARNLEARQGRVDAAIEDATKSVKKKPSPKARKIGPAPLSEIKKTKHKGAEGETSYGQRMKEPVMGRNKTRFSGDYE